jgi:hypothetical protein
MEETPKIQEAGDHAGFLFQSLGEFSEIIPR